MLLLKLIYIHGVLQRVGIKLGRRGHQSLEQKLKVAGRFVDQMLK